MSHQIDSKNGCHGRYSFRGFGRNLFNRMMKTFGSRWFIAIIEEVYRLGMILVTFILVQQSKFPSIMKKTTKMVLRAALSAVDAAKQFDK